MKNKKIIISSIAAVVVVAIAVVVIVLLGSNKDCKHEWSQWETVKEATCMVEGEKSRKCTKCEEKEKDVIAKVAHSFTNYVAQGTDATCIDVTKIAACDYEGCTATDTKVVTASTVHNYVVKDHTELSCEENEINVVECTLCKHSYEEVVALATGHSVENWDFESETLKEGTTCEYTQVYTGTCGHCSNLVEKEEVVTKHVYEVTVQQEATCVSEGTKVYTCSCGYSENKSYTNEHAHTLDDGVVEGSITKYSCTNSGCNYYKTAIVAKDKVETSVSKDNLSGNSVELKNASIALDETTLAGLGASDVTLTADVLGDAKKEELVKNLTPEQKEQIAGSTIYDFKMTQDSASVSEFSGKVTITIPYELEPGEDPDNIAIWYVNDNGDLETIKAIYANGSVSFETNHFSYYTVTRLSPKERCALYGHIHLSIEVEATCTSDGYTLNICQRCGISSKDNVVKAAGHDFESKTTDATCTLNGSIVHTCTECGLSYTEVILATGHNYKETERIEATTEKEGLVKYTCEICGKTKEQVLPKLDGTIKDLTDVEIIKKALTNFNVTNMLLVIKNSKILNLEVNYRSSDVANRYKESIEFEIFELYLGLNDNNELVGSGTFKIIDKQSNVTNEMLAKGYLSGNKLYLIANLSTEGVEEESEYIVVNVENSIIANLNITTDSETTNQPNKDDLLVYVSQMLGQEFTSFADIEKYLQEFVTDITNIIKPVIDSVVNVNKDAYGKIEETILTTLYSLNKLDSGYEISLNVNKINDLYKYLTETKVYDIIENIVGEKVLNNLDLVFDFSVDKLIKFVESKGLVIKDLVNVIDEVLQYVMGTEEITLNALLGQMMENPEFDILEFLNNEDIRQFSVKVILEQMYGVNVEELKTQINTYLESFKEVTIVQMFSLEPAIFTQIGEIVKLITNNIGFKFVTDSEVNIVKANCDINFEYSDEFAGMINEDFKFNFEVELVFNKQQALNNSEIKSEIDNSSNKILTGVDFKAILDAHFDDKFQAYTIEYVENGSQIEKALVTAMGSYRGQLGTYTCEIYYNDFINPVMLEYNQKCKDLYKMDSQVVVEANFVPLNTEKEQLVEVEQIIDLDFVYNTTTKETICKNIYEVGHEYIRNPERDVISDKCGEFSKYYYICRTCGATKVDTEFNYHDCTYENIVMYGDSCTDGYEYDASCEKCDYSEHVVGKEHKYLIESIDISEYGSVCGGEFIYEHCLCNQNSHSYPEFNCDMEEVHWQYDIDENSEAQYKKLANDNPTWEFEEISENVCSVTDPTACKFRYTRINYFVRDTEFNCLAINYTVFYFGHSDGSLDDAKYVLTIYRNENYAHIYKEIEHTETSFVERCDCGAAHIEKYKIYTINDCTFKKETLDRRENENPKQPSWYQYEYQYSFEPYCVSNTIYTNSEGVRNEYSDNQYCIQSWPNHVTDITIKEGSCTQDEIYCIECLVCGRRSEERSSEPNGHNWNYNSDTSMYECYDCGLESENGASGLITLEDCSIEGSDTIRVGYYIRHYEDLEYTYNITLILKNPAEGQDDQVFVSGVTFTEPTEGRFVEFSRSQVEELAQALGYETSEYNIRISFVPSNYDDDLDYAITFE